ncbi:hypothetical protein [Sandaracinus amylolyticus]|uniref:hypothetical protein n=1 Tax=Sandaracinus amylolyticus TaxID=927083 RepID=UPI001F37C87F|nr:hypothetical protein [Sandaracinus amylolyticus]
MLALGDPHRDALLDRERACIAIDARAHVVALWLRGLGDAGAPREQRDGDEPRASRRAWCEAGRAQMNQLDLVWPGVVVVLSVAGAIVVRVVAMQAERAARARHRRLIDEVWHERRGGGDRERATDASTSAQDSSTNVGSPQR